MTSTVPFVDPTKNVAHRPWPLPERPWVMTQRWSRLLFMHWPVPAAAIRSLVPRALALDLRDGMAWVTIAPFYLDHLRARWLPTLPWGSEFHELNVRTYVSVGGKPGVYFFSLDADSPLAVTAARTFFHLPYFDAAMCADGQPNGDVHYASERAGSDARFEATYGPEGPVQLAEPGSLDDWLTARYCLYAVDPRGGVYRTEIHHAPWPLQPAHADARVNTMLHAAGILTEPIASRLAFSRLLDVVVWLPERVG